jgi:hypothetical protein
MARFFGWAFSLSYCLRTVVDVVVIPCSVFFFPLFHAPTNTPHSLLGFPTEPHLPLPVRYGAGGRIYNRKD